MHGFYIKRLVNRAAWDRGVVLVLLGFFFFNRAAAGVLGSSFTQDI